MAGKLKGVRALIKLMSPEGREAMRDAGDLMRAVNRVDDEVLLSGDREAIRAAMDRATAELTPTEPRSGFAVPDAVLIRSRGAAGIARTRRCYDVLVPGEEPLLRIEQPPEDIVNHLIGRLLMDDQWDISLPGGPVAWRLWLEDHGYLVLRTDAGDEIGRIQTAAPTGRKDGEIVVDGTQAARLCIREGAKKSRTPIGRWRDLDAFEPGGRQIARLVHGTDQPPGGIVMESEGSAGSGIDPHDAAFYLTAEVPRPLATLALMAAFHCVKDQYESNHYDNEPGGVA